MASKPPSRLFPMVLVMLVALPLSISSVGHDVHSTNEGRGYEEVKDKAKRDQDKAAETAQESKEASESWAEWAKEKLSEGLGLKHDGDDDGSKGAARELLTWRLTLQRRPKTRPRRWFLAVVLEVVFKGMKAMSLYGNFTFHHLVGWPEDGFVYALKIAYLFAYFVSLDS